MSQAIILLQMAIALLQMAQGIPNLPADILKQVTEISSLAVSVATTNLGGLSTVQIATSTPVLEPTTQATSSTQIVQNQTLQPIIYQYIIQQPTQEPALIPALTPVIKSAYAREAWQIHKNSSQYPYEWQIVTDLSVPLNISGRAKGLTWEFYLNGVLIHSIKNTREEHLGGTGLFDAPAKAIMSSLKSETTYTYKIVAKESGRENSIYEDTFTTGTKE